tara:strand:- start:615 stop:986 length:372 start_codon:yes stop_codon:yes gene_type:complete
VRWISSKTTHYNRGKWAEYYAAVYLLVKGYRISEFRYKTKVGEIDIVARKRNTIIFVEVKYRQDEEKALTAVVPQAQKRIRRAAEHYLNFKKSKESLNVGQEIRFDVIGITKNFSIRHIDNAF